MVNNVYTNNKNGNYIIKAYWKIYTDIKNRYGLLKYFIQIIDSIKVIIMYRKENTKNIIFT